ncbi:MAG: hypothetical protein WB791_10815 [Waddliaceae bacterium]
MKKHELKKLAMMGLAGGLLFTHTPGFTQGYWGQRPQQSPNYQRGQQNSQGMMQQNSQQRGMRNPRSGMQQQQINEQELLSQLNKQGRALYQSLDSRGKALALKLANQGCEGQNSCEGLNSCRTEKNSCSGEGGCQGQSSGPFKDKNLAIRVAAKHLAKQRQSAARNMLNNGMDRIPGQRNNGNNNGNNGDDDDNGDDDNNGNTGRRGWFRRG